VKLAITRALVLLCHKCIVEFEKTLLLSRISSRIWVVAMFSYLGKTEKIPWFPDGKTRIKHWHILPTLPLESFDWVLFIQLQFARGFHSFPSRECQKSLLGFVRYNCKLHVSKLRTITLPPGQKTSRLVAPFSFLANYRQISTFKKKTLATNSKGKKRGPFIWNRL